MSTSMARRHLHSLPLCVAYETVGRQYFQTMRIPFDDCATIRITHIGAKNDELKIGVACAYRIASVHLVPIFRVVEY